MLDSSSPLGTMGNAVRDDESSLRLRPIWRFLAHKICILQLRGWLIGGYGG